CCYTYYLDGVLRKMFNIREMLIFNSTTSTCSSEQQTQHVLSTDEVNESTRIVSAVAEIRETSSIFGRNDLVF
ncbi:hypothetical protein L9F63_022270, partial [Diploptera punctata]